MKWFFFLQYSQFQIPEISRKEWKEILLFFFCICPPPGLLPVLGPCERYMTPTLDAALLISSRAGTDPGLSSDSGV